MKSSEKRYPRVSTEKLCSRHGQGCTLCWMLNLIAQESPRWCWFWRCWRDLGEHLPLGTVWQGQGWSPWRKPRRGYWSKYSSVAARDPSSFGNPSAMRWPPRTAAALEYRQLEPKRQGVCYKGQNWRCDLSPWRSLEDCECISDIGWLEFDFIFYSDCALIFFPLEGRRYFSGTHS